ncbi:hypothetical protein [Nonomuraea jabiensis]|uniref:Uncharacterized protein n=1 Tax=Nonomuraea jabiensis TaxID=882448 RepID=A0A7W9G1K4_9ACTN|nr:hypothetical protein [Nonomuraea jabiensis]MBB5775431.1 hypothetical protein [Nonomuraea jabiensis]
MWQPDPSAGATRLAVIGRCAFDADRLAVEASRLRDPAHLARPARTLPGSFHLVAALDGRLRVQGTASGLRLVFHARVNGPTVASDRADALAAGLDVRRLAAAFSLAVLPPRRLRTVLALLCRRRGSWPT